MYLNTRVLSHLLLTLLFAFQAKELKSERGHFPMQKNRFKVSYKIADIINYSKIS